MESYEAIQAAVNGKTVEHAKALGLSVSMVSKWQEPSLDFSDSGAYNPLDRIKTVIATSLALGNPSEKALSPLHYLAERFNQITIPVPAINKDLAELHQELSRITKEFGDVLATSGERLSDGNVTAKDARLIGQEAWELHRALASFMTKIRELAK